MFLLDTNVVSELRKIRLGRADKNVAQWAERRDSAQGAIFRSWLENHVLPAFAGRILPVDTAVAQRCAALHVPDPGPAMDSLIAATALVHGMTLVTRNVMDFRSCGVAILNPWEAQ